MTGVCCCLHLSYNSNAGGVAEVVAEVVVVIVVEVVVTVGSQTSASEAQNQHCLCD